MSAIEVRLFRRSDREQLAKLVNAHAQAVVPGIGVSVAALLSSLEREPGEYIVDPWVRERVTLVAEQNDRVMAAAHLLRYRSDQRTAEDYRDLGEIRWLLFWPLAADSGGSGPAGTAAAEKLVAACLALFATWGVSRQQADGALPVPGVYGVPEQWRHIRDLYRRAGFVPDGSTEVVELARVADLPRPPAPPISGLAARRSVGINGTRLSAVLDAEVIGYIEVEILEAGERLSRSGGWADIGNLHLTGRYRRRGVGTWLLGQAADWLRLAQVDRLLAYTGLASDAAPDAAPDAASGQAPDQDDAAYRAFYAAVGFRELTRTRRGWTRVPPG